MRQIPIFFRSILVLHVTRIAFGSSRGHWQTKRGKCDAIASLLKAKGLLDNLFVECDNPEGTCTFSCANQRKPKIRQTRCICKNGANRKGRHVNKGCVWTRSHKLTADFCEVKEMSKIARKDDMVFGQWQAQMMLDKGQQTTGIRVDKKIDINPMFANFLGRSGGGGGSRGSRPQIMYGTDFIPGFYPGMKPEQKSQNEGMAKGIESRLDISRAIGAVIKWDRYREGNKYVIPYFYQEGYAQELRTDIERALTDLGDNTCIDFRVVTENDKKYDNKIKIVAGSGCYSYVGFQGVPHQSISLREVGCLSRGTVQHEFMHALGFYHEQARPDAEDHINVKYNNVGQMCGSSGHESCKSQFDQLPLHEWEESRSGGAYDIGSVMHYGGYDFSANGEATLLDASNLEPVRDQRLRFSQSDAEQICEIYQCDSLGHTCMGGKWTCADGNGFTFANKLCDGLTDCADGSDEEGCIEKTCCDKINIDGMTFLLQPDRTMNSKPFYELEGEGEDVYLYYYHDGKKNRYWLISKYINVLSVFGYSFEEMLCPQEMHIRSSLGGSWKWAWAECAHSPKYGEWSAWTDCQAFGRVKTSCQKRRIRHCKGGQVGYHPGCPKGRNVETESCTCGQSGTKAVKPQAAIGSGSGKGGKWTMWGSWGSCSRSCGHGERQRIRSCQGGQIGQGECMFDSWKESEVCNEGPCPGWGSWTSWSGCDKTCDNGEQVRTRQCNGAKVGSPSCPTRGRLQRQPCGGLPCPKWSSWQSWSPCTSSCGEGVSMRIRGCLFAELGDAGCPIQDSRETQTCFDKQCDSNTWSLWGQWTDCPVTCGSGIQVRHRDCLNKKMEHCTHDGAIDRRECNTDRCNKLPGRWSQWAPWSACSATCGGGSRNRSRTCIGANAGDPGCLNGKTADTQECGMQECASEEGCLVDPAYQYSMCRLDKKIVKGQDGYFPDGTTCNQVRCSKQFYGFVWKGRTVKTTCQCANGTCGWDKTFHKCPIGCPFPPEWDGERCVKPMDKKTISFFSLKHDVYYTPKSGKCKTIRCANDPSAHVNMPKCNCDVRTADCEWNKVPDC